MIGFCVSRSRCQSSEDLSWCCSHLAHTQGNGMLLSTAPGGDKRAMAKRQFDAMRSSFFVKRHKPKRSHVAWPGCTRSMLQTNVHQCISELVSEDTYKSEDTESTNGSVGLGDGDGLLKLLQSGVPGKLMWLKGGFWWERCGSGQYHAADPVLRN